MDETQPLLVLSESIPSGNVPSPNWKTILNEWVSYL